MLSAVFNFLYQNNFCIWSNVKIANVWLFGRFYIVVLIKFSWKIVLNSSGRSSDEINERLLITVFTSQRISAAVQYVVENKLLKKEDEVEDDWKQGGNQD